MPFTIPNVASIVATPVAVLDQDPPLTESVKVYALLVHTCEPVMTDGGAPTVTVEATKQPSGYIYVMYGTPAATPVTLAVVPNGLDDATVANVLSLLVHDEPTWPPTTVRPKTPPTHTFFVDGVIDAGVARTEKVYVAGCCTQPVAVNVIVAPPAATPVTRPEAEPTEAVAGALLVQTPLALRLSYK